MSGRNKYKRRIVERGRAQAKATKAGTSASLDAAAADKSRERHPPSPPKKTQDHGQKLIDRLGRKRPMAIMTVAGLVLGVAGLGVGLYFGLSTSSPEPVIGKPIPAMGGQNPTPLFQGRPSAHVNETELILYSLKAAIKEGYSRSR